MIKNSIDSFLSFEIINEVMTDLLDATEIKPFELQN